MIQWCKNNVLLLVLILFFIVWLTLVITVFSPKSEDFDFNRIPEESKFKIKTALKEHGLDKKFNVIFIKDNNEMFFIREGEKCKFKGTNIHFK